MDISFYRSMEHKKLFMWIQLKGLSISTCIEITLFSVVFTRQWSLMLLINKLIKSRIDTTSSLDMITDTLGEDL